MLKKVLLTSMAFLGMCPAATAATSACPETRKLAKELARETNGRFEIIEKPDSRKRSKRKWRHGGRP
jgi:hypothetical protein